MCVHYLRSALQARAGQLGDLEKLFMLIALNCTLRNDDAHLKNFGIVCDDVLGQARLAPVCDLVTTAICLPKDSLALTPNGTTRWPAHKRSPQARGNAHERHSGKDSPDPNANLRRPFTNRNRSSLIY